MCDNVFQRPIAARAPERIKRAVIWRPCRVVGWPVNCAKGAQTLALLPCYSFAQIEKPVAHSQPSIGPQQDTFSAIENLACIDVCMLERGGKVICMLNKRHARCCSNQFPLIKCADQNHVRGTDKGFKVAVLALEASLVEVGPFAKNSKAQSYQVSDSVF